MNETIKDCTGKNHTVEIYIETVPENETENSGFNKVVVADIDGERIFRGCVYHYLDYNKSRFFSMLHSVEYFLSGKHHPTHYTGKFAHLGVK